MSFNRFRRYGLIILQNRELQIMRIVRHPNIVELKAFYYSNGDRVSSGRQRPDRYTVN